MGMKSRWGFGAAVVWLAALLMSGQALAAAPQIRGTKTSEVGTETAILEAELNPEGEETLYRFEYGAGDCAKTACTKIPVPDATVPPGTSFVKVKKEVKGLTPNTLYHFRLVAHNTTVVKGPDHTFVTRGSAQVGLPDGRAYEQASPTEKNGDDAEGYVSMSKAAVDGNGVTFGSTFGIPSTAQGAQEQPFYTALRGSDWSTHGMLPPATLGERAYILGWLPDLSESFSVAIQLASPPTEAFVVQDTASGTTTPVTPYVAGAEFTYAGASKDGSTILLESKAKLLPAASTGNNVYAYDTASKALSLASQLNTQAESEAAVSKGAFAGPYDWGQGLNAGALQRGGARRGSYLQDNHAVSEDGSVYFTAAGTGQLYLRQNPTQTQSPLDGEGNCTNPVLACTIQVTATEKTNGNGPGGSDAGGAAPAAFQAATGSGTATFFTSPEMLTNDANTGLEQPQAAIVRDTLDGNPTKIEGEFIPKHALGVAVDGSHVYWADPTTGAIGRATIDPVTEEVESEDPLFIAPGETECETEIETSPGHKETVTLKTPSAPRYVAVDAEHIYWTNTGPLGEFERPINGCGTIGRADLDGNEASVEPEYIKGASNPQGVAVNATRIYWANAANEVQVGPKGIGRALLGEIPSAVEQKFFAVEPDTPYGVALSATHVYFSSDEVGNRVSYIKRAPLEGGEEDKLLIRKDSGTAGIRGITLQGEDIYWAQGEEKTIGRAPVSALQPGECDEIPGCEREFIKVEGSPIGLAADSAHLYWSVNGEASLNPGNDLYRFDVGAEAGQRLKDLTPLPSGSAPNGAEVQGVVGASADGSHVYFTANGVLAAGAAKGDCRSSGRHGPLSSLSGECNLYLWQEGTISFVTRLSTAGGAGGSDALDWVPASEELFGSGSYVPRTAFLSADGQTLLFRSREKLSAYDNEGTPELYRYRVGDAAIRCVSCNPAGEAAKEPPSLGSVTFPNLAPRLTAAAVSSRNLSADGNKAFFESDEALSVGDVNKITDVYEWEAPGSGSCNEANPSYSPINEGCIFLISSGTSPTFSQLIDASASGNDVFFLTRQQLVGQDKDELRDAYDARVGGGIASQNPQPDIPCESAGACHGPAQSPPAEAAPSTQTFVGPGNPPVKHKKPKKHKAKKHKKHKQAKHKKSKHQRAAAKGRTAR